MGTKEVMEKYGEARLDAAYAMLDNACGYCGIRSGKIGDKITRDIDDWKRIEERDVRDYHLWMDAAEEIAGLMLLMESEDK